VQSGAEVERTALVVDDDPIAVVMISTQLWTASYQAVAITTSEGLVEAVELHGPSLVVLDVRMPGVDGPTVARRIRSAKLIKQPRIVLHSSLPRAELSALAADCGADGFAEKTSGFGELLAVVLELGQRPSITTRSP
jgi:CheY-like chemotaxis protein